MLTIRAGGIGVWLRKCVTAKPSAQNDTAWERDWGMNENKYAGNQIYVEGLKRYQEKGIRVLIDGEDASDATWSKLFEVREDGSFYMGDYILEDIPSEEAVSSEEVKEEPEDYMKQKRLKEIHFDMVYHQ